MAMTRSVPLLQVNDLRVQFTSKEGDIRAVDGLTFTLYKNEILGIVGESGCGKSVTAKAILNVLSQNGRIAEGSILFMDGTEQVDIAQLDPDGEEIRKIRGNKISMIHQEPMASFSPVHTIGDQIGEVIELHTLDRPKSEKRGLQKIPNPFAGLWSSQRKKEKDQVTQQTMEILARVGMPNPQENFHAYSHNLSGGMRQRAMIAMGLACNPTILIADEPTTALDVTLQSQVLDLMQEMQSSFQMSIIFITHDLGVIAEIADRVVVMYLGRVMETAPVDNLFYKPLHPYTQALILSVPRTTGPIEKLVPIAGTVPSPLEMPVGCKFHTRCPKVIPGICDVSEPELQTIDEGHEVACFLYNDQGNHAL